MAGPEAGKARGGGRRVVILAFVFALLAQGCFILSVSLTRDPF